MRMACGSFVVLEDADLTVESGEIVAVTGVNGAGKSMLLSCGISRTTGIPVLRPGLPNRRPSPR